MSERIVICRSNPVAPDPRVEKTAQALLHVGHDVTILAWDRAGEPLEGLRLDDVKMVHLTIPGKFGSGIENLKPLMRWQRKEFRWLWQHRKEYTVIHACDFDTVIPAILMKYLCGKTVIYDIFDFYSAHIRLKSEWIRTVLRWLDYRMIHAADGVILVDESRKIQLKNIQPKHLAIVVNTPSDQIDDLKNVQPQGDYAFRIAYIGMIQYDRGLQYLIELLSAHPDWLFELAGFGGDEEAILKDARQHPNLTWHGRVPYPKALEINARCDVLLATYDPAIPNNRLASPNKVFEAMMLSKPVIVTDNTTIDQLITSHQAGISVPFGDAVALEKGLLQLQNDSELCKFMGNNGRKLYEKSYNWELMETRLVELYQTLLPDS